MFLGSAIKCLTTYRFEVRNPNAKLFRKAHVLQKSRILVKAILIWASYFSANVLDNTQKGFVPAASSRQRE